MFKILASNDTKNVLVGIDIDTSYGKKDSLFSIIVGESRERELFILESKQIVGSKTLPDLQTKVKELVEFYTKKYGDCKVLIEKY